MTPEWLLMNAVGTLLLAFSSMLKIDVASDSNVAIHTLEAGAFEAYNKVQKSTKITVTLGMTGSSYTIGLALVALKMLKESAETINFVMPEDYYPDMTVQGYNYSRKLTNGNGYLEVTLVLVEVRNHLKARTGIDFIDSRLPQSSSLMRYGLMAAMPIAGNLVTGAASSALSKVLR